MKKVFKGIMLMFFLLIFLQIVLVIIVNTSTVSQASFLYNKWYFLGKPLCKNVNCVKDGDVVHLGSYPYSSDGELKPIEWKVVHVGKNRVELLSVNILEVMAFNPDRSSGDKNLVLPWSQSLLRQWLNDDFFNVAFSAKEQQLICLHNTVTNYARYTETGDMKNDYSEDYVYIPYFPDLKNIGKNNLSSSMTPYALSQWRYTVNAYPDVHKTRGYHSEEWAAIEWVDKAGNGTWWLRSPGCVMTAATYVMPNGNVWNADYFGKSLTLVSTDDKSIGVRPMICVDTSELFDYLNCDNS